MSHRSAPRYTPQSPAVRVRAGIGHALAEAMDEGHCGLPEEELGPLAARLLEVPAELIRAALDLELADGAVVADRVDDTPYTVDDTPYIFVGGLHRAERAIAGRILDIAAGEPPWPGSIPAGRCPGWNGGPGSPWRRARAMPCGRRSPRRSR